jgi:hypothetical protein
VNVYFEVLTFVFLYLFKTEERPQAAVLPLSSTPLTYWKTDVFEVRSQKKTHFSAIDSFLHLSLVVVHQSRPLHLGL